MVIPVPNNLLEQLIEWLGYFYRFRPGDLGYDLLLYRREHWHREHGEGVPTPVKRDAEEAKFRLAMSMHNPVFNKGKTWKLNEAIYREWSNRIKTKYNKEDKSTIPISGKWEETQLEIMSLLEICESKGLGAELEPQKKRFRLLNRVGYLLGKDMLGDLYRPKSGLNDLVSMSNNKDDDDPLDPLLQEVERKSAVEDAIPESIAVARIATEFGLSKKEADLLVLGSLMGFTAEDIAEMNGEKSATVRKRLERIKKKCSIRPQAKTPVG